jgi:hypothetical protein
MFSCPLQNIFSCFGGGEGKGRGEDSAMFPVLCKNYFLVGGGW